MNSFINKGNWWLVLILAVVLVVLVGYVQQNWLPDAGFAAFALGVVILGLAFYWVYTIDKQGLWWAQIVALGMVVVLITGIVVNFTPQDASGSSPYGVVTFGLGIAIMGFVLKHPGAKIILYASAIIALLVGILMLPISLILKIILIVVEVLVIGYLAWQTNRQMTKS